MDQSTAATRAFEHLMQELVNVVHNAPGSTPTARKSAMPLPPPGMSRRVSDMCKGWQARPVGQLTMCEKVSIVVPRLDTGIAVKEEPDEEHTGGQPVKQEVAKVEFEPFVFVAPQPAVVTRPAASPLPQVYRRTETYVSMIDAAIPIAPPAAEVPPPWRRQQPPTPITLPPKARPVVAPKSSAANDRAMDDAPARISVTLDMSQVQYYTDATGRQRIDSKTSPIDPPYPGMVFKGYSFSGGGKLQIATANFVNPKKLGQPGARISRPSGIASVARHSGSSASADVWSTNSWDRWEDPDDGAWNYGGWSSNDWKS